jgi:hypothetical protein
MSTKLPTDSNNNPIPALRLKSGGAHRITTSGTSARNSTAFSSDTKIVSLYATQDVYLRFGGPSVTAAATDHFFPAGLYYDVALGGDGAGHNTHVAALQVSAAGSVYISEKE